LGPNSMAERMNLPDIEESETQKKEIVVAVSKKSLRVFQAMFPTSAEERISGEEWNNFVHAMAEVGFGARHCAGSEVRYGLMHHAISNIVITDWHYLDLNQTRLRNGLERGLFFFTSRTLAR
jgi:hypothetical protein